MRRSLVVTVAVTSFVLVAGCGSTRAHVPPAAAPVRISADLPPSPTTWPAYPRFSRHACWERPFPSVVTPRTPAGPAPSYAPAPRAHATPPVKIVQRFLARLGDRRYIRSITLGPASATIATHTRALMQFGGNHPPADALHAFIHAPLANYENQAPHATPAQHLAYGIAEFEAGLVGGALRDDFCSAGGAPLISWSGDAHGYGGSGLEQRFPNPTPAAFRHRVALVGRRFGFRVASLRLLRPEQLAPVLVVRTSRPRKAFVNDAGKIMALLDPTAFAPHLHRVAETFEGFFFAAEDARGPFSYATEGSSRSGSAGSGWVASLCLLPPGAQMGPSFPKHCT